MEESWLNTTDWRRYQIGQCTLHIHIKKTKEFYLELPKISENCSCGYCRYFEKEVINQPHKFFEILKEMEVDLSRQPNINPDGVCCVGHTETGKLSYMGNYFIFGEIINTSKNCTQWNDHNPIIEVAFKDSEFGDNTQIVIKQVDKDKISAEFYMEVDKSPEFEHDYIK